MKRTGAFPCSPLSVAPGFGHAAPSASAPPSITEGEPQLWLGTNFWSASGGPLMWRNYDPQLVRRELRVLADHGLNLTRSFCYWPDFMPTPDALDEQCCERLADFLAAHLECGMRTIPTFLVGHMSGENWDPAWRAGRHLYRDVWFVGRQAFYIRELTRRIAHSPAIAGWLLTNEVPIYGGEDDEQVVTAWANLLVDAVRAGGGMQPVSVGDGAWGVEVTGHDSGFSTRGLDTCTDFIGPHVYKMESDRIRQHLKAAFICELAAYGDKPVILEEFGLSTDFATGPRAASYYRQAFYTSWLAGATGWISWNNTDYDAQIGQRPYSHHPFEMHFGITTADGQPKEPLIEQGEFAKTLAAVDAAHCHRSDVEAALVVPSHLAANYPFTTEEERALIVRTSEQAYAAAREACLPVGVVREQMDGGLPEGYSLYVLPSVKQLCGPSWRQLIDLAAGGATIYASYCAGESPVQRGPWWAYMEEIFGVRQTLTYGLVEPVEEEQVTVTFEQDFGSIHAGEQLSFRAAGTVDARSMLPVEVLDGEVIARDGAGRPALVVKRHGAGRCVICTYPLEYFAAAQGRINPEQTYRLYEALADLAGVVRPIETGDPCVWADTLDHEDGRRFAVLISQHDETVTCTPRLAQGRLVPVAGAGAGGPADDGAGSITIPPLGVRVLQLVD